MQWIFALLCFVRMRLLLSMMESSQYFINLIPPRKEFRAQNTFTVVICHVNESFINSFQFSRLSCFLLCDIFFS